jgi:hypothetical protein
MSARHPLLTAIAGMALAAGAANNAGADAPVNAAATLPASWQSHTYQFHYMGFTATYSCDGLGDKLQLLLRLTGARPDAKVMPSCARGYGVPDQLAGAQVVFSTLQPAAAGPDSSASAVHSMQGVWRHVELAPRRPFDLQGGDCELIEQFRDTLLPMFATRNVSSQISCVPHQQSSSFSLSFDVFAPPPKAKGS